MVGYSGNHRIMLIHNETAKTHYLDLLTSLWDDDFLNVCMDLIVIYIIILAGLLIIKLNRQKWSKWCLCRALSLKG